MMLSRYVYKCVSGLTLALLSVLGADGQTVFTAFQSAQRQADQFYRDGNFSEAAARYEQVFKANPSHETNLRIARCYYFTKKYSSAITWYEKLVDASNLLVSDQYYLAESYAGLGNYKEAILNYQIVLKQKTDDILVAKKIWQLQNIQYLFEDSLHYVVQRASVNTTANEFAPRPYEDGLIFLSNRASVSVIENRDAESQAPFYRLYNAPWLRDSLGVNTAQFGKPVLFEKDASVKFQEGPVAFFNQGNNLVYVRSSDNVSTSGRRTLQLYFAQLRGREWITVYSFPYNSTEYSIVDPSITEDGTVLYFSSDMKGGQGGKDLYRSINRDGKWRKPENLTDINTPYDEVSPFIHQNRVLYFSSTGQAGMGGLDVFKAEVQDASFSDIVNVGYPINTHYDDFSLVLDSAGALGYFTSNRINYQDDVFSVDIDMQPYPLTMEGVIRFKEIVWNDTVPLKELTNARLILIDNVKGVPVFETFSDSSGNFLLHIPYFSQYKLKVIEPNKDENIVSLEVPRHRKKEERHDIVVVREVFKP